MSGRPLLSVVMPVHNPGKYLAPCIDSVLAQTFDDFELIAIDDKSSDGSLEALRAYVAQDARVMVLANETNLGAARTRNRGLDLAQGEFVIFLDADDFFDATYFEENIELMRRPRATVAISPFFIHDETTGQETVGGQASAISLRNMKDTFSVETFPECLYQLAINPFNKFLRRDFLKETKLKFQDIPCCNDVYFGFMVLATSMRTVYNPVPHVHYRANLPGHITSQHGRMPHWLLVACEKAHDEMVARQRWAVCRRGFYTAVLVFMYGHIKIAIDPSTFLQQVRDSMARLDMGRLTRESLYPDWMNDRVYAMYQLILSGNAMLGNRLDTLRCFFHLIRESALRSAYWLAGHYVKQAMRRLWRHLR